MSRAREPNGDTYAPEWTGPRSPCGCPERDDYAEHPGEPCDWSPWHLNGYFPGREDRFCWKCGAMETQVLKGMGL